MLKKSNTFIVLFQFGRSSNNPFNIIVLIKFLKYFHLPLVSISSLSML